jgi:hypothetical protein
MIALFVLSYDAKPVFGIPDFSGEIRKEICTSGGEKAREALCESTGKTRTTCTGNTSQKLRKSFFIII